jgi:hypothetical protein
MKKIFTLSILITLAVSACISPKKLLQKGEYDEAINKTVKKLSNNPEKEKGIDILKKAYGLANQNDLETIAYLKKTGEPDIWDKIFNIYYKLKNRQNMVKVLPQALLTKIGFEFVNYDEEIIQAKQKAAAYFYVHAQSLLAKGDRSDARNAYYELNKVKGYYTDYKDADSLIDVALFKGTAYILFQIKNQTTLLLPEDFETALTSINIGDLNKLWLSYDSKEVKGRSYAYLIMVDIKSIDVSPDALKEVHTTETKEIEDGYTTLLDDHGNVVKDSLGNDIKIPKFKTISCEVIQVQQKKTAIISGTIDYIDNENNQLLKTDPVTAQSIFENTSATAIGDPDALKPETKAMLGNRPLPFPSTPAMILLAGDILKGMAKDIIWKNKVLFD